jgi:hypothetical protein
MKNEHSPIALRNGRDTNRHSAETRVPSPEDDSHRIGMMIGSETRIDGGFEASFALQLAGIRPKAFTRDNVLFDATILEHLLAVPEAGERIELRYHWQPQTFSPELKFHIRGVATGDDWMAANRQARRLFERVWAMLAGRRDCKFTSLAPQGRTTARHRARASFPRSVVFSTAASGWAAAGGRLFLDPAAFPLLHRSSGPLLAGARFLPDRARSRGRHRSGPGRRFRYAGAGHRPSNAAHEPGRSHGMARASVPAWGRTRSLAHAPRAHDAAVAAGAARSATVRRLRRGLKRYLRQASGC